MSRLTLSRLAAKCRDSPFDGRHWAGHGVRIGRGRGGRRKATRNLYHYSDRQLPPGHDPGADSGEAPNGRQRGSRPLDILVECRGCDRLRREYVRFATFATVEAIAALTVGPCPSCARHAGAGRITAVTAGTVARRSRRSRR
jgi:hypothetical protein